MEQGFFDQVQDSGPFHILVPGLAVIAMKAANAALINSWVGILIRHSSSRRLK
jgi:hypothetical protein